MIIDTLDNADRYTNLHPGFKLAFDFLRNQPLATMKDGTIALDGDKVYASMQSPNGIPMDKAVLEFHRKYIDIQYVLSGDEAMGWSPLQGLGHPEPFNEAKDVAFAHEKPLAWFPVRPGSFAIFFPEDAHAPNVGEGPHRKVVIKIQL